LRCLQPRRIFLSKLYARKPHLEVHFFFSYTCVFFSPTRTALYSLRSFPFRVPVRLTPSLQVISIPFPPFFLQSVSPPLFPPHLLLIFPLLLLFFFRIPVRPPLSILDCGTYLPARLTLLPLPFVGFICIPASCPSQPSFLTGITRLLSTSFSAFPPEYFSLFPPDPAEWTPVLAFP